MTWNINDYVIHKKKADWGVGKVLKVNSQDLDVFFVYGGKRIFAQPAELLDFAPADQIGHQLLANVAPTVLAGSVKFYPLPECIKHFYKLFPDGFYDPRYLIESKTEGERHYKVAASKLAHTLLNKTDWHSLLLDGNHVEICQRLAKVESKTNLLHSFEKIKWHAALKNPDLQPVLAEALFHDLYGTGTRVERFKSLAKALESADGCGKWTIATYYGFLLQPEGEPRIFIKPEVTKFAAESCGWDIQYDSQLNWNTLSRVEELAQFLDDELTRIGLKPRDMIDIQSFIWCIDPKSYGS